MLKRHLLSATIVYSGLGTPRNNGAVVVQEHQGQKQLIAIDDRLNAQQNFPDAPQQDIGFAISPPPVNAHTHLDLSSMPFSPGEYHAFILQVIRHTRSAQRGLAAAKEGVEQLLKHRLNVIGDIVTDETVMRYLLGHPGLKGVAYWEVIGIDPAKAEAIFNETTEKLKTFRKLERPGGMRVGLSPHTPYTVSAPLLQKLSHLAKAQHLPMQIHVAESPAEVLFLKEGAGPLKDMIQTFLPEGWQAPGLSPLAYLEQLGILEARPTLVHMVHVNEEDIRLVQKAGCAVIHCPRSNEALNCGRFPWELYAKHGVTVGMGTDSLGSSPSLSIEEEVFAAMQCHGAKASPQALVWSAVKGGYRALGMQTPKFVRGDDISKMHIWQAKPIQDLS